MEMELSREQIQDELQIAKNMNDSVLHYVICAFNKRLLIHNNQVDLCIRRKPGDWIMIPIIKKEDIELLSTNLIAHDSAWFTVGTNLYFYSNPTDFPWATQEDFDQEFRVFNLSCLKDPVPQNQSQLDELIENLRETFLQERYTSLNSIVWDSFNLRGENLTYDLDEKDEILKEYRYHMYRDRDFNEFMSSYVDYDFDGTWEYADGAYWLWPIKLEVEFWESELSMAGVTGSSKQQNTLIDEELNQEKSNFPKTEEKDNSDNAVKLETPQKKEKSKNITIVAIFLFVIIVCGVVIFLIQKKIKEDRINEKPYNIESVYEETSKNATDIAEQITKQLDQLTEAINALPEPTELNAARCGDKVKVLQWEVIDIPEDDPNAERLKQSQRHAVETFVKAKNRYIKKIEKYDEYAGVYYDEVEGYLLDDE